jgi:tannase/feruloyl esterase
VTRISERSLKRSLRDSAVSAAVLLSCVAGGSFVIASPAAAWENPKPVSCASLAAYMAKQPGINLTPIDPGGTGLPPITSSTPIQAAIVPAAGSTLSYCQVVFQLNPAITINVGLPLNTVDGATGVGCSDVAPGAGGYYGSTGAVNNSCVQGNWNGKIEAIGNGGFSGLVPMVTGATNLGFVGSSTDNGHSANWCNAINPKTGQTNALPNCSTLPPLEFAPIAGGFVLTPDNQLITSQVTDFIDTSEVDQITWAKNLANEYYGRAPKRVYWNGCSTGGRQGFQMAQFHPELLDGILVGSAVMQWNRFIPGSIWFPVVLADVDPVDCPLGTAQSCNPTQMIEIGPSAAFNNAFTAATSMAVADCDSLDGVQDGVINEPRLCHFSAKSMIGQTVAPMTAPMTAAQAEAIDLMWDGPRNQRGQRLWGGISKGTGVGNFTNYGIELNAQTPLFWVYQNPSYNIISGITTTNFSSYFQLNDRKFADTVPPPPQFVVPAATDIANLDGLRWHGGKLLAWSGQADGLVVPFRNWNYDTRLLERYDVRELKQFYRSFYYPGNGHCGGNGGYPNAGLANTTDQFNALIDWVENNNAPDTITAYVTAPYTVGTTNARLICPYPAYSSYNGSGPILSSTPAANYTCVYPRHGKEDPELAAYDQTATQYYEAP